jgi:hypothetical protein
MEFLNKNFTDLQALKRPHPRGQKLFIKQAGLHLGNVLYEGFQWKIQYYHQDGSYVDTTLPDFGSVVFWDVIKMSFNQSVMRGIVKKTEDANIPCGSGLTP